MSDLANKALEIALGQEEQDEKPHGSNWGHPVQDYLGRVGINFPASWCMAFIYWCFDEAATALGLQNPLFKTGGVLTHWNHSKAASGVKTGFQAGDIFIQDHGKGLGHTGIIVQVNEDGTADTIEGNTNDTGSREGFEVAKKRRKISSFVGALRY